MDDTDYHLGMHDVFVIGKCIDAANDIVYLRRLSAHSETRPQFWIRVFFLENTV